MAKSSCHLQPWLPINHSLITFTSKERSKGPGGEEERCSSRGEGGREGLQENRTYQTGYKRRSQVPYGGQSEGITVHFREKHHAHLVMPGEGEVSRVGARRDRIMSWVPPFCRSPHAALLSECLCVDRDWQTSDCGWSAQTRPVPLQRRSDNARESQGPSMLRQYVLIWGIARFRSMKRILCALYEGNRCGRIGSDASTSAASLTDASVVPSPMRVTFCVICRQRNRA